MFGSLKALPADPILGLLAKYREDANPQKIDLGVGVYKNEAGHTAILDCVKAAEKYRHDNEDTKVYIGPTGSPLFNEEMSKLIFGDHQAIVLVQFLHRVVQVLCVLRLNLSSHVKPVQLFG